MIISRTPLRVSFVGGGTDLPAFFEHTPGAVVSTAIDKYIYVNVNKKFDRQIRASYSITEIVDKRSDLKHELIRESLDIVGISGGVEITSISDIPSQGSGLGSSSSYTVGLLNALYAYTARHVGAERLAREACVIELERCGKPIGKQDQYIAAYGGFQYIRFNTDGTVFVEPIICKYETKVRLQQRLMMFYTGKTRSADNILKEQSKNTTTDADKRSILTKMKEQADYLRDALCQDDVDAFGEVLHEAWLLKRQLASGITSGTIDDWYAEARKHGAIGGKILGAGGGGFLLLYANPEQHDVIADSLVGLRRVPFRFEPQGSKIVYVEEGGQY
jgi:D-glycero-alpha-D-manno-heptose-7-phosphate kinase